MNITALIAINVIIPLITGFVFFIFFLYFVQTKHSKAKTSRYFSIFLISFSIYLVGRPLQVLAGAYPMPVFINNFRLMILCAVTMPALLLATDFLKSFLGKNRKIVIFGIGILLGVLYSVFNTIGTTGSVEKFRVNESIIYYSMVYSSGPPSFGKDIISLIQTSVGIILVSGSLFEIVTLQAKSKWRLLIKNHILVIDWGVFVFGISFIIGSIVKQWSVSYICSVTSAIIIGYGVLIDIRRINSQVETLLPFIKEEIIRTISFSSSKGNISEMLSILGKKNSLDTFVTISFKNHNSSDSGIILHETVSDIVKAALDEEVGEDCFITFPLSGSVIGISVSYGEGFNNRNLLEFFEKVKDEIIRKTAAYISIGIGRQYGDSENLSQSYHEALRALEYAGVHGENCVIHVDNIDENYLNPKKYPFREKEKLLLAIKLGDIEGTKLGFTDYFSKFRDFVQGRPEVMKIRLYELIGSLIDSAIFGGGDEERLHEADLGYFSTINNMGDISQTEKWLYSIVLEIVNLVADSYHHKGLSIVNDAKRFIEENFNTQLTVEDVASEIGISRSYFLRLFKEKNGFTFTDYLTRLRIIKAKELLLKTDKSITEIAFEIGFNDSNYFSKVFSDAVNISPTKFRKNNQMQLSEY